MNDSASPGFDRQWPETMSPVTSPSDKFHGAYVLDRVLVRIFLIFNILPIVRVSGREPARTFSFVCVLCCRSFLRRSSLFSAPCSGSTGGLSVGLSFPLEGRMAKRLSLHGMPKFLILAILLLFFLFTFLLTLVFVKIIVPGYRLTTGFKVAYNIINTVLATILARFAASQIQKQWLRLINHEISDVKYELPRNPGIAARWRAVLGISTFNERIMNFKTTGLAQLSFVATALITAAIVAAVTLTDTTCVSIVHPPRIHSGADNKCTRNVANNNTERLSPLWEFRTFWNRDDGSAYFATTNLGCPSWSGAQNLGAINTINPEKFAYARNGVAVTNSAIGAPEILYTDFPKLVEPLEMPYGHLIVENSLQSVSHCLPIMARNPVKCTAGGKVSYKSNIRQDSSDSTFVYNTISVDAGGCNFTQANSGDPSSPFGIMVSRLCPTWNSVGEGTVAIGATGIISLTLAASMGDSAFLAANAGKYEGIRNGTVKGLEYSVSCSIDVKPTIKWRTLTLELQQGALNSAPSYSKLVSGVDGCPTTNASANWNLGDGYAGGAVAALEAPLSEGRYWNGMTNSILNRALNVTDTSDRYSTVESWQNLIRKKPYGFNESANALEDVLGLTTGITMSQMSTLDSMAPGSPLSDSKNFYPPIAGNATFACTRVGSGNKSALLFTVPPLLALMIAVYLLSVVPKERTKWKTSRLEDFIAIGMASERELALAFSEDHKRRSGESSLNGLRRFSRSNDDREILTKNAAAPGGVTDGGWGQRWVTDATGTHAIPVKMVERSESGMDGSWTTGLPKSPVRMRHEDGNVTIDVVPLGNKRWN
jgi:hypothetical protein